MENNKVDLPPLPGSDEETLRRNSYDSFYKKRPSDLWVGKVNQTYLEEPKPCDHFFVRTQNGVECKKCHMGLIGNELKVTDGHIYFGKQKLL
jgi:hypothetical protein